MEAHAVHYNDKYKDFEEAVSKDDGLAVLAFFIQASGDRDCSEFSKITDSVQHIQQANSKCAINSGKLRIFDNFVLFINVQRQLRQLCVL